jgi:hypothetical protein
VDLSAAAAERFGGKGKMADGKPGCRPSLAGLG